MLLWPEQPGGQQLTVLLWAHQHLLPVQRLLHDAELHSHICGLHAHCWRSHILHDMRHLYLQVTILFWPLHLQCLIPPFVFRQCHPRFFCFFNILPHQPVNSPVLLCWCGSSCMEGLCQAGLGHLCKIRHYGQEVEGVCETVRFFPRSRLCCHFAMALRPHFLFLVFCFQGC